MAERVVLVKAITTLAAGFLLFFGLSAQSEESNIYGKGWNGKYIEVEGVVGDIPKLMVEKGGKTRSYSFRLYPASDYKRGDEYVQVVYYTLRFGKKVGEFSAIKGDKVTLTGLYTESKESRKNGKVGSLSVNSNK